MSVPVDRLLKLRGMPDAEVPCNGCTACCKAAKLIPLLPEETQKFPHEVRDDVVALVMKKNGECIYLMPTGCHAHADKPIACRTFDCAAITTVMKDWKPHISFEVHRQAVKILEEGYEPVIPDKLEEFLR